MNSSYKYSLVRLISLHTSQSKYIAYIEMRVILTVATFCSITRVAINKQLIENTFMTATNKTDLKVNG